MNVSGANRFVVMRTFRESLISRVQEPYDVRLSCTVSVRWVKKKSFALLSQVMNPRVVKAGFNKKTLPVRRNWNLFID